MLFENDFFKKSSKNVNTFLETKCLPLNIMDVIYILLYITILWRCT